MTPTQLFPITVQEKITCVTREIIKRRDVYARLVAAGKMSKGKADREIEIMESILADYLDEKRWTPNNLMEKK
jgi:hypothetical protein